MLNEGITQPAENPHTSPLHLVPKPDQKGYRPCIDYRKLKPINRLWQISRLTCTQFCVQFVWLTCIFQNRSNADIGRHAKNSSNNTFRLYKFEYSNAFLSNKCCPIIPMTIDQLPRELPFSYAYIDDILIARANQAEHLHQVFQRISKFDLKNQHWLMHFSAHQK